MSHFTVLVIGDNPEKQLQPYHEYECTGIDDEFVIDVDKSGEVEEWMNEEIFVGKKGGDFDYEYNEESAKKELKEFKKMSRREYFELISADIDEEVADYHGYEKKNGKWIRHTNPNNKWDWYTLGGRWTGFFKMKNAEVEAVCGEPGLMTLPAEEGYADQLLKKDIDFDAMRNVAKQKAEEVYSYAMSLFGDAPVNKTWDAIREANGDNIEKARELYWAQPRCVAWKRKQQQRDFPFGSHSSPDDFLITKEEYLKKASDSAITTFAVIKDGQWYERGKMGWWACVSNENDNWEEEFSKLLDTVPDDTVLSVYDCHI